MSLWLEKPPDVIVHPRRAALQALERQAADEEFGRLFGSWVATAAWDQPSTGFLIAGGTPKLWLDWLVYFYDSYFIERMIWGG